MKWTSCTFYMVGLGGKNNGTMRRNLTFRAEFYIFLGPGVSLGVLEFIMGN